MENPNFEPEKAIEFVDRSHEAHQTVAVNLTRRLTKEQLDTHCHVQKADTTRNKTVWRKLITVLILCIFFMIAEIVGGILAHSISIQTDAAHMAADIAGFFFSIMAIYISGKGKII